ncbi:MAG: hypothetical protein WCA95_07510 [Opitutaceae bacterium]|jgi:hypothetical protein
MNPFLKGRKSAGTAALEAPHSHVPTCLPGMVRANHAPAPGPSVEVVKEGDRIVRLIVKCTCGEKLEVECLYSS